MKKKLYSFLDILDSVKDEFKNNLNNLNSYKTQWNSDNSLDASNVDKLIKEAIKEAAQDLNMRTFDNDNDKYVDFVLDYRVWNKKYNSTEEKLDDFIEAINTEGMHTYTTPKGESYL